MLYLHRNSGEQIVLYEGSEILAVITTRGKAHLTIEAIPSVGICRREKLQERGISKFENEYLLVKVDRIIKTLKRNRKRDGKETSKI